MKLAIMQPYFFPYVGYFQLINAVDKFVIYDDVNYIKQGWINKNKILLAEKPHQFSVPLANVSSFKMIKETILSPNLYIIWRDKFLKTLRQAYFKSPNFSFGFELVKKILFKNYYTISELNTSAILEICNFLNFETQFIITSSDYQNDNLKSEERILDICKKENATFYINPIGGKSLYNKNTFKSHDIELFFFKNRFNSV